MIEIVPKCCIHDDTMHRMAYYDSITRSVGCAFFCLSCATPTNLKIFKTIKDAIEHTKKESALNSNKKEYYNVNKELNSIGDDIMVKRKLKETINKKYFQKIPPKTEPKK